MDNKFKNLHGWVLLDKPCGITSRAALNIISRTIRGIKVGHAGTLDPFASGLLPIALGEATKTIQYAMSATKEYDFEISWGESRDTLDAEGKIIATSDIIPSKGEIENIIGSFVGRNFQRPPVFSAIKVRGRRSCDLAREGVIADLKPRLVDLFELKIANHEKKKTKFYAKCGKGYYIRALARDISETLGACGYVSSLRRLSVGDFNINHTISLDFIELLVHNDPNELEKYLYPLHTVLDGILVRYVSEEQSQRLRQGQKIQTDLPSGDTIAAMIKKRLVAICKVENGLLCPVRVFNL